MWFLRNVVVEGWISSPRRIEIKIKDAWKVAWIGNLIETEERSIKVAKLIEIKKCAIRSVAVIESERWINSCW